MVGALVLSVWVAAPGVAASERSYGGPEAVESPAGVRAPKVAVEASEASGGDAASTASSGGSLAAPGSGPQEEDTVGAKVEGPAPRPEPVVMEKRGPLAHRPVPRLLSTVTGEPLDEQASFVWGRVQFRPGLQVRNQVGWVSPFTIDRLGNRYEEGAFSTGRIRWNPTLEIGRKVTLAGSLDLANGRWAPSGASDPVIDEIVEEGSPPGRTSLQLVDPRELYVEWRSPLGMLRVGQQAFTWGQGILANDGNHIDRFGDMRFGSDAPGDIYERVLFATRPFQSRTGNIRHLVVAVGGDVVFRDERASLVEGDLAGQALVVLRYQPEDDPGNWIGGYGVYRNQRFADDGDVYPGDDRLEVGVFDLAGQGTLWLRDDFQLIGAFESAFIFGKTTAARDERGGHKIAQGGLAGRAYMGDHDRWLVGFDAGYASGDPNPDDRWLNNFVFDAGHPVGLVLFDQVQGWRTAQTEILATNGELIGEPLNGTEFLPTRGGVTNAVYAFPKARIAFWERLELWGGPLMAFAPVPIVDPYTTRLSGGNPTNSVGGSGDQRYYGTEFDLGVRGRVEIRDLWLQAGLQGGLLLPGPGLANAAGNTGGPVGAVWLRTEIRY